MNRADQTELFPLSFPDKAAFALSPAIRMTTYVLACSTAAIALLAGIGWLTDSHILSAFGETFYPMAPRTICIFLLFSTALFLTVPGRHDFKWPLLVLIILGIVLSGGRVAEHLMNIPVGLIEQTLPQTLSTEHVAVPAGRMALATSICFLLGGAALLLLSFDNLNKWRRYIGAGLSIGMIAVPLIFLLGYAYRAPLDYHGEAIPMALNTSIAFMTLGAGIVTLGIGYELAEKWRMMSTKQILAAMTTSSNDAIIGIKLDNTIIWWNNSAERLFGYTAEEVVGRSWSLLTFGNFFEQEQTNIDRMRRSLESINKEVVLRHKNGYPLDIDISAFPLQDENGNVYAITGVCRDISQRKKLERERYMAQSRLQAILDNTSSIIFLKDTNGKYLTVNRRCEEVFDASPGSMIGKTDYDYFPRSLAETFRNRDEAVMTAGTWMECEEVLELNDGAHTFLASLFALKHATGEAYGVGGIITDITQRKQAEMKISELNAILTRQAEALEGANKELESFSYSVSHDLRAPLRSVAGFSQVIQEDYASSLDEKGQDYLNRIRKAADDMSVLIDDILSLSRVTRREMKCTWINVSVLAEEVIASLRQQYPDRNVTVDILPCLRATADKHLVRIVFENLLGNAWKYTSKKTNAQIEFGSMTLDNGEDVLFIRDNGAGFDMSYVHKLFGAFQRLHRPDEFEGTGIGLATVQRIIRRHGGRIWAEGEVDKGATFYFTLPVEEVAAYAEATHSVG